MFVFLLLEGSGSITQISANSLVSFGGNIGYYTNNGEYFRLFTSIFLHAGLFHLVCNMYSLYVIGPQVESFYGKIKYLFIFLFSGIAVIFSV